MACEGNAEGADGAVANALCDFGDSDLPLSQQLLGHGHAPSLQIVHGRDTDSSAEAVEKGGP